MALLSAVAALALASSAVAVSATAGRGSSSIPAPPRAAAAPAAAANNVPSSAFWFNLSGTDITDLTACGGLASCLTYEAQAVAYALQGLANRGQGRLLFDNGFLNVDFPQSDEVWKAYFETPDQGPVAFTTIEPDLCSLIDAMAGQGIYHGSVTYPSDGVSLFVALTVAGARSLLPVSPQLSAAYPCLASLREVVALPGWPSKFEAYAWALENVKNASRTTVYNADVFPGSMNGDYTLMSVDYPVSQAAFVMNIIPCWEMVNTPACTPEQVKDTELFMTILRTRDNLVNVWGWSDPEHAYTNATTVAGGTVFCTFSTSNLAFWRGLGESRGTQGLAVAQGEPQQTLDANAVYLSFETNEGDTPRILTSQFTSQWLSPNRGSLPVAWAVDPYLGELFPELWNFYVRSATPNDTFLAGVDGAGYVYVHALGGNAAAYEARAASMVAKYGLGTVDVGVANAEYAAVTLGEMEEYLANANASPSAGPGAVAAFVNACGASWGQPLNAWLADGTPVINSVCSGPAGATQTNYLYYYRDDLNATDPAADLVGRIEWAAGAHGVAGRPLFLNLFGGLGVYGGFDSAGGYEDFFTFSSGVVAALQASTDQGAAGRKYVVVGAQELARLARLAAPSAATSKSKDARAP